MPNAELNGASIYYEDRGQGPALILLHGFPVDGRMWAAQLAALARAHRVIVPDLRGFGRSPNAGPFTIESLADEVHALASALKLDKFSLGGLSMGGYIALAYARRYANTLRALILLDTKAEADSPEAKQGRNTMIELARSRGSAAIADAMQPKVLAPDTIARKPEIVSRFREWATGNPPITLAHALAALRDRPEQAGMLKSIVVPTLVVVGEHDAVTPPAVAEAMHREIPGSRLVVIPGAGHFSPMENPDAVNAALIEFLAGVEN